MGNEDVPESSAGNQMESADVYHHGTFIIAFSLAKQHLAVSPEREGIVHFSNKIEQAGYGYSKMLVRFPWDKPIDFSLLEGMIEFNIADKEECTTFWRK